MDNPEILKRAPLQRAPRPSSSVWHDTSEVVASLVAAAAAAAAAGGGDSGGQAEIKPAVSVCVISC